MVRAEREYGRRSSRSRRAAWMTMSAGLVLAGAIGCSQTPREHGYFDQGKTQIQFFSPPGTNVTVRACSIRSHEVAEYGPFENRLEQTPEEFAVFNLRPGRYEFKYTSVDGLPGASIYGELEVMWANSSEAAMFQRRAFIPVSLPSEAYKKAEITGNEIFPYRGEAYRTAIDENDIRRLREGDVVEKVFFVADMEAVARQKDQTAEDLKVLERKLEYIEARFRNSYYDFRIDVSDPSANFWRTDREFIRWEKERQEALQKQEKLESRLRRMNALLKGDTVLTRKGMLALATEEVVASHKDVARASGEVGEVLLVMRIGGRHMKWSDPNRELAAGKKY